VLLHVFTLRFKLFWGPPSRQIPQLMPTAYIRLCWKRWSLEAMEHNLSENMFHHYQLFTQWLIRPYISIIILDKKYVIFNFLNLVLFIFIQLILLFLDCDFRIFSCLGHSLQNATKTFLIFFFRKINWIKCLALDSSLIPNQINNDV
jgi:hypothetical protein